MVMAMTVMMKMNMKVMTLESSNVAERIQD